MSLNNQLVAMNEKQPWKFFALQGLNFQFLELNFQFLEGNFKMSEPCESISNILNFKLSIERST
jgi:hypothetical protein